MICPLFSLCLRDSVPTNIDRESPRRERCLSTIRRTERGRNRWEWVSISLINGWLVIAPWSTKCSWDVTRAMTWSSITNVRWIPDVFSCLLVSRKRWLVRTISPLCLREVHQRLQLEDRLGFILLFYNHNLAPLWINVDAEKKAVRMLI